MAKTFLIYRASAGSGKTFNLVKEFLKLSLSAENDSGLTFRFKKILAITFTNKATNEMKQRIIKYLKEISNTETPSDMAEVLCKELNLSREELGRKVGIVMGAILHNYSDLSVLTIDKFMHNVVRTFAHDLNLPVNFEVQVDQESIIQEAVSELIAKVGTPGNEAITRMIAEFSIMRMDDSKSFRVDNAIEDLAKLVFEENSTHYLEILGKDSLEELLEKSKQLRSQLSDINNKIKKKGTKLLELYEGNGLQMEDFKNAKDSAFAWAGKVSAKGYPSIFGSDGKEITQTVKKQILNGEYYKKGSKKISIFEGLKEDAELIFNDINSFIEPYATRELLLKNFYQIAFLNTLYEIITLSEKDNEILHLSECNKLINNIVQNEPMPFIYERLGTKYQDFLIDEFQDTSKLQWSNIIPLVENSLSEGNQTMIVGDGKQAIYRFRQGDAHQFAILPKVESENHQDFFNQECSEADQFWDIVNLETNYRSCENVVNFNNEFFTWATNEYFKSNEEVMSVYIGNNPENPLLAQKSVKKNGYVEINLAKEEDSLKEKIFNDIENLIVEKGYEFGDITILADKNKSLAEISEYLSGKEITGKGKIPLVSAESFIFKNSMIVKLIRASLLYLLNIGDKSSGLLILENLHQLGIIKETHYQELILGEKINLGQILAKENIEFNSSELLNLSLYDCCEELIRVFKISDIEKAYVVSLLNKIQSYTQHHTQDKKEFIDWLDKRISKLSCTANEDLNAIQLLTVHKAKGLEAPIVIYYMPKTKSKSQSVWVETKDQNLPIQIGYVTVSKDSPTSFKKQLEEEIELSRLDKFNLLYVALTRPKEQLRIYCQEGTSGDNNEMICKYYQHLTGNRNEDTENTIKEYHIGEKNGNKGSKKEERNEEVIDIVSFDKWDKKIQIADHSEEIFQEENTRKREEGILIHEALSEISSKATWKEDLNRFSEERNLVSETHEKLLKKILPIMTNEETSWIFGECNRHLSECSLVHEGMTLRPDRIIFKNDSVWVVDFKTQDRRKEHAPQVLRYCDALEKMGYKNVKGALLYIREGKVETVR